VGSSSGRKEGGDFRSPRVFHNNVNSKTLKSIEEMTSAVVIMHNLVRIGREEVIPTRLRDKGERS
jgi:hypothetical protein